MCPGVLNRDILGFAGGVARNLELLQAGLLGLRIEAHTVFGVVGHVHVIEVFLVHVARVGLLERPAHAAGSI